MRKRIVYCFRIFLCAGTEAQQNMTVQDAVQIALKNNLGIQIAKNSVAIATINNSYGIAGGLPFVNASAGNTEQFTSLKQQYSDPANNKSTNNASTNSLTAGLNASV